MENQYGIGINNRYALFLEGEDGGEALIKHTVDSSSNKQIENMNQQNNNNNNNNNLRKPLNRKDVPVNNNKSREDKENRVNDRSAFPGKRVMDARKAQDGPRESRESREDRNNRRNRPENNASEGSGPSAMGRGGGPRGRGRGGPGSSRGRGKPKREFERKSGDDRTGVKAVDKREGGGSHNWGTMEDEMKAEEDKANVSASEEAPPATHHHHSGEDRHGSEEEGDEERLNKIKTLTLEEWKAQEKEKREIPTYNTRKAGEGSEIDPKWKKTYAYKKEKETNDDEDEEDHELYPQRVNRQKRIYDIEVNYFSSHGGGGSSRGGRGGPGGGRGGRGGGRGGGPKREAGGEGGGPPGGSGGPPPERGERRFEGGRGGGNTPRKPNPVVKAGESHIAPNVNDEASFPTLGGMGK
eukprot:TRINITY_DN334_c0_g1_i2.p1 TRINITY_DN334_c0_g1~~TRINITY_DN334_c0_g1_i2.p1  ORF type:complete len:411 (-),score=184.49 TRINITY_DN334_c0_g1_i2:718-1950(-)